jgi:hypothetical protein
MANKSAPFPTQNLSAGNKTLDPVDQRDGIVFLVASRAAAEYVSNPYFNPNRKGIRLYINLTVVNGGTLTVKVQTFDPASQTWVDIPLAVTAALAAVAVTTLTLYPGLTETANVDVAVPTGVLFRVVATTAVAAVTFGIGGEFLG